MLLTISVAFLCQTGHRSLVVRKAVKTVGSDIFNVSTRKLQNMFIGYIIIKISEWKINSMGTYTAVMNVFVCKSHPFFTLETHVFYILEHELKYLNMQCNIY